MTRKLKLIIDISPLTSFPITGVGKILQNLIYEFQKRQDLDITYFALVARGHLSKLRKQYPNLKAPSIPARLSRKALYFAQAINFPQDLITGPADATLSMSWLCLPIRSGKTVAIIADMTVYTNPEWHARTTVETFKRRLKSIEKNADLIYAISNATKKEILQISKIPEEKIQITYPGLPKEFSNKVAKNIKAKAQKKYRLPKSYLLFVGTQEPRKNLNNLVKAFAKLNKKIRHQTKLVLVGNRGWGKQVGNPLLVQKLGYLPDEDLPAIYSLSKGLVYPSLKEGFGLPIVQAFAMEVPVLTSNISSMAEIAKGAAILVDPYSVDSLKKGLEKILSMDKGEKKQLITAGKKRLKKFRFEKMADNIINSINKLQ